MRRAFKPSKVFDNLVQIWKIYTIYNGEENRKTFKISCLKLVFMKQKNDCLMNITFLLGTLGSTFLTACKLFQTETLNRLNVF